MLKGVLIMLAAGLILSTGGSIIREIDEATGFQIVFWRSVSQSVLVFLFLFFRDYRSVLNTFVGIGLPGMGASICLGLAFFGFVFSITNTTVANTMFLISSVPFFTAVLAWPLLKERVAGVTWIAILVALTGVLVMVSQALALGKLFGNVMGLFCAISTAFYIIFIRWGATAGRQVEMIPVVCLAGIVAALLAFSLEGGDIFVSRNDFLWSIAAGALQNGPGFMLFTIAARYLPAAELALLGLVEVIISPIWVWLLYDEIPALFTLVGGSLVLLAVIGLSCWTIWRTNTT